MMRRPEELNKKQHHTELFNSDYLIVRRGQEFQVKITFNRPYNPATDKFAVEFVIGEPLLKSDIFHPAVRNSLDYGPLSFA